MSSYGSGGSGGGGPIRALYGVWIDQAVQSGNPDELKQVLTEARKYFDDRRPHVLYGVVIDQAIQRNNPEELRELLTAAKAQVSGDLQSAVQKLETHVNKSGGSSGSMGKK